MNNTIKDICNLTANLTKRYTQLQTKLNFIFLFIFTLKIYTCNCFKFHLQGLIHYITYIGDPCKY